jgi:hypothetical protein
VKRRRCFIADQVAQNVIVKRAVDGFRDWPLPPDHPDQVTRNAIQKTFERTPSLIEPGDRPHELHKYLMSHFLGYGLAAGHVQREAVQRRLAPFVQPGERVLIAFPHPTVEFLVAYFHQRSLSIDSNGRESSRLLFICD